jgi:hypothetical protein
LENDANNIGAVIVVMGFFVALIVLVAGGALTEHLKEIQEEQEAQRKAMKAHQDWLFNQLYALGPGKVLAPDEVEEVAQQKPAKVYSPTEDPMSEFTGLKDDWHA